MFESRESLNRLFRKRVAGKIVHECKDRYGAIQVIDDGVLRSLHFDSIEKQSCMSLEDPKSLVLTYTQSMMAGLLMNPDPGSVLCVGLGGGSIPRFLQHYFPRCRQDIIDIREKVVELAQSFFLLENSPNLTFLIDDASTLLQSGRLGTYDLILVDAYDQHGISGSVIDIDFISASKAHLKRTGMFVINLWSEPKSVFKTAMDNLSECFPGRVLTLPVSDRTNRIVLCLAEGVPQFPLKALKSNALKLEKKCRMGFFAILKLLYKSNPNYFKN